MTTIAHRLTPDEERTDQIEWFTDLRQMIVTGQLDAALEAIDAAIKMRERERRK